MNLKTILKWVCVVAAVLGAGVGVGVGAFYAAMWIFIFAVLGGC